MVRQTPAPRRERTGHLGARPLAAAGLPGPSGPRARHHLRPRPRPHRCPQPARHHPPHPYPDRPRLRERRRRVPPLGQEAQGRWTRRRRPGVQRCYPGRPHHRRTRQRPAEGHRQSPAPGQPRPHSHHPNPPSRLVLLQLENQPRHLNEDHQKLPNVTEKGSLRNHMRCCAADSGNK